ERKNGNSCKHRYWKKYYDMLITYQNELSSMLQQAGFVKDEFEFVQGYSQSDVVNNYGFDTPEEFFYQKYKYSSANDTNTGDYGTIGDTQWQGGSLGGGFVPTMNNTSVFPMLAMG